MMYSKKHFTSNLSNLPNLPTPPLRPSFSDFFHPSPVSLLNC